MMKTAFHLCKKISSSDMVKDISDAKRLNLLECLWNGYSLYDLHHGFSRDEVPDHDEPSL